MSEAPHDQKYQWVLLSVHLETRDFSKKNQMQCQGLSPAAGALAHLVDCLPDMHTVLASSLSRT